MTPPLPTRPQPDTGLPPGVEVGPLGSRVAAYVIDSLVPALLGVVLGVLVPNVSGTLQILLSVLFAVAIVGWIVFVLHGVAVRAASPGMRAMKLQLVGFYDGRPIGWGRAVLRWLVFGVLGATGVVWLIMVILMVTHPRHQGWHDLAAKAVMIKERVLAPTPPASPESELADPGQQQLAASLVEGASAPAYGPNGGYPDRSVEPARQGASAVPVVGPTQSAPTSNGVDGGGWTAYLDDGRRIDVHGLVLLGRNPAPQVGEEDAQLIKLADETRTVSKSHLAIGLDATGLFVVDRGSTNGSTVTSPSGVSVRCQPSQVVKVEEGSIVSIGDHWLEIRRSDGTSPTP